MKLMGASMLSKLAASAGDRLPSGAVAALRAELDAAAWNGPADVLDQYPAATIDTDVITIPMGDGHCVCLVANYKTGMVAIEYAGRTGTKVDIAVRRKPS